MAGLAHVALCPAFDPGFALACKINGLPQMPGRASELCRYRPALTFDPFRSTYRPPAAGPLIADIRRGFKTPEQSSPHVGSTFKERAGRKRAVRIPYSSTVLARLTTDADI
ncbi:hypothetical protein [Bradyrhizobium sp.]|uniref:hypothetical protein n=1 Tax=Bradyrhizobium sp. TaxID=376 RepID=UPI00261C965B|nr:hypothetical protein [Bradyrhizobium sp.]